MGRTSIVRALSGLVMATSLLGAAGSPGAAAHAAGLPFHGRGAGVVRHINACDRCYPPSCMSRAPLAACRGSVRVGLSTPDGVIMPDGILVDDRAGHAHHNGVIMDDGVRHNHGFLIIDGIIIPYGAGHVRHSGILMPDNSIIDKDRDGSKAKRSGIIVMDDKGFEGSSK
jgi:hypothetical protein